MNIKDKLREIINNLGFDMTDDDEIPIEDIDSVSFISLIVEIEQEFNIEFYDEYLSYEILNSFDHFVSIVNECIKEQTIKNMSS